MKINTSDTSDILKGALKGKTVDVASPQKVKIHHYDVDTGELIKTDYAMLDPVGNNPMIPANATDLEPPPIKEGYARCFDNGWRYRKDDRGKSVYHKTNGSNHFIKSLLFDIEKEIEFTFDEPKPGQVWNFAKEKWDYPYRGIGRIFEPFIRLCKSIIYISDMADEQERIKIITSIKKLKNGKNKT